jgi:hypothetical protein
VRVKVADSTVIYEMLGEGNVWSLVANLLSLSTVDVVKN